MGFAALSPHLGRPRAANLGTVSGVDFAVGVDFGQSCDLVKDAWYTVFCSFPHVSAFRRKLKTRIA